MKKELVALCAIMSALTSVSSQGPVAVEPDGIHISNPVPLKFGDPFLLHASDGNYYMYGTSLSDGFEAYVSYDGLRGWEPLGQVYRGGQPGQWNQDCFWAPEVYERDGRYYMFYSANSRNNPTAEEENFKIGVAVSDTPAGDKIKTAWGESLNPENVWQEYPRPIMERSEWLNLNGLWNYAILPKGQKTPENYQGEILVPFCAESSLSGVGREVGENNELWYQREFMVPASWKGRRVMLNFGAVDWKCDVWVNGTLVGGHTGGFAPFGLDITDALAKGRNELVVRVWDPTDRGPQPRGKQVSNPEGIWYTPVTGIWQTVWLEPVPETHITALRTLPDIDAATLTVGVLSDNAAAAGLKAEVKVKDNGRVVAQGCSVNGCPVEVRMPEDFRLWSPDSPNLYDLEVTLHKSGLDPENFKAEVDGKSTALYTLVNSAGMEAAVTNYGGRLVSLMVPDRDGTMRDVVLGHDSVADYINIDGNFGALIGRYGNRIDQGRFSIDSIVYQLPQNNFGHCLHGGPKGFHHSVWDASQPNDSTLVLTLSSPDGEAGFPGNIDVKVTYSLTADNALDIAYEATTDKPTILNLTNHSYFNLSGDPSQDVLCDTARFVEREAWHIRGARPCVLSRSIIPILQTNRNGLRWWCAPAKNTPAAVYISSRLRQGNGGTVFQRGCIYGMCPLFL